MTALKPCPWCGDHPSSMRADAWENGRKIGCARIWCPTCSSDKAAVAPTPDHAFEQAAEAWGRRAPDPVRDAMARVCEAADGLDKVITGSIIHLVSVRSVDMAKDVVRHKAAVQTALAELEQARKGEG